MGNHKIVSSYMKDNKTKEQGSSHGNHYDLELSVSAEYDYIECAWTTKIDMATWPFLELDMLYTGP